jgi:hypothetical protein
MQWHDQLSLYWAAPTLLLWILALAAVVHAVVRVDHQRR